MAKIGAVINNASGNLPAADKEKRLEIITQELKKRISQNYFSVVSADGTSQEVQNLLDKEIDILVIGGGDGTISTVANMIGNTPVILAILPLGTRNHFARDLGIPLEPEKAIQLLDKMQVQQVDLGEVNGRRFINNASIGLYPKIVKEREKKKKNQGWRKWLAHMVAAVSVLRWLPIMRIKIEIEGKVSSYLSPFVFVGNNEYQGGIISDPLRTSLNESKLWLCMARAPGIFSLLHLSWLFSVRNISKAENAEHMDAQLLTEVTILPKNRRISVAIDGEIFKLEPPLQFKILKKSLNIVAP